MNGKYPSTDRILLTANSLNTTLPLCKSMRKLVKQFDFKHSKRVEGTLHDVDLLYNFLVEKLGQPRSAMSKTVNFDANFWYHQGINEKNDQECSQKLEDAWVEVSQWVRRYSKFFIESDENFVEGDGDKEDEEEENDMYDILGAD